MQIDYVRIVNHFYPEAECYSIGPAYTDVIWSEGTTPIAQGELDQKHLDFVKWEAEEKIKAEASRRRDEVYALVLGTEDPSLVRIYEEKETQARYYLDCVANTITPDANRIYMLEQESTNLGVTKEYLSNAIIAQADHANSQIMPMIGEIEGIRRAKQFAIVACSTDSEVEALMAQTITWPDTSTLVII